jgi:RNA polymerase sigma-70 factor, ECF subfamily
MKQIDITELVDRARGGDTRAFAEIYDRYLDRVYCFVLGRIGGDRPLAEDLTSEVFLRALRNIKTFEWCGRDIGAWLLTIARNLVYDHFKSSRSLLEFPVKVPSGAGVFGDQIVDPEDEMLRHVTRDELHAALRRLTLEQREVVYWRFLQGYSIAETGAVMCKSAGAIKAMQYRAVCALYALIAPKEACAAVGA